MLFITRLPVQYNDGAPIPQAELDDILFEANTRFGGCTLEGVGRGVWRDDHGRVYDEPSHRLEIACGRSDYEAAREFVLWSGRRLRQKAMYFEARYMDGVEILDVD